MQFLEFPSLVLLVQVLSSSVSAGCGLAAMTLWFSSWQGQRFFAFYQYSHWLWGQPSFISSGKAEQGSEANHTHLSNAKAKNAWSYISPPPIFLDTPSLCSALNV